MEEALVPLTTGDRVPKVLGADVELANFLDGVDAPSGTGREASRLLIAQVRGVPASRRHSPPAVPYGVGPCGAAYGGHTLPPAHRAHASGSRVDAQASEWGRKFLPGNGGCIYVDMDHLELALPETRSAFDHVVQWRAMLHAAREALRLANARVPAGCRVRALANCSDGHGHSYGAHVNVLLTREAWDAVIRRKPHYLAWLAAFQVSSIVFTGAGKVGSENGQPSVDYQLTQRGDFFETLLAVDTSIRRPIVNTRDEALCGTSWHEARGPRLARLHVIFFDATLCQVATLLRAGTLQIAASMMEAGCVSPGLALDDPLDALQRWGHDPTLTARARLLSGEAVTAVELQRRFLDEARRCAAVHGFDGLVPRAGELLDLWDDTLGRLAARDFDTLARRLDWVLKRRILERAIDSRPGLTWRSPEIRHLDQLYASIDPQDGLFWACEQAGLVDAIATEDEIGKAVQTPPEDTRAWTRAHLLRRAGPGRVEQIDWDSMGLLVRAPHAPWKDERRTVYLPDPHGATQADCAALFAGDRPLEEIVEALEWGAAAPSHS